MDKKYLILAQPEEEFPEQFNSHMFLIMEAIYLSKKLGRTFVLPFIHSHPRNSALCEKGEVDHRKFVLGKINYPLEDFFDINKLSEYVDIITFEDFIEKTKGQLSCIYTFNKEYDKSINIYDHTFTFKKTIRLNNIYEINDTESESIALTGCRRRQHTNKNSPNWHNDPNMDYWEIRKSLKYKEEFFKTANEFINNKIGFKTKYLAIHWRRGDRVHPELGSDKEDIINDAHEMEKMLKYYLIDPIKSIMSSYNIEKVFLATNSGTKWHLDYLKTHLPIIQYEGSGNWQDMQTESIIEQIICIKSNFYISSPYNYQEVSSFSRWIIDEKRILGENKNISYQQKMRPISNSTFYIHQFIIKIKKNFAKILGKSGTSYIYWNTKKALRTMCIGIKTALKETKQRNSKSNLIIKGNLFDNKFLHIDSQSTNQGGAWINYLDNMAQASDHYLIQTVYEHLKNITGPVMLDIGAHTGSFSLLPVFNSQIKVYAFEPSPWIYELLKTNIKLNNISKNTLTYNIALSNNSGVALLKIPKNKKDSGLATLGNPIRFKDIEEIEIKTQKIDSFIKEHNIKKIDFIKIDTEGAELSILNGGIETIKKYKPYMLIECDQKNTDQFGYNTEDIETLLQSVGYKIEWLDQANIFCTPIQK